jgi:transposase
MSKSQAERAVEVLRVVDVEYIRKLHYVNGLSQREIARRLHCSRSTIAKYLQAADVVPRYRRAQEQPRPAIDPVRAIIDKWLDLDDAVPRKQRHTARRIFHRLRDEYGYQGSERAVERYVRQVRPERKAFIPLAYEPGMDAQCDWGEADVVIGGCQVTVQIFCMRLCASGASFVMAFPHQRTEAFQEGHRQAFEFFGGMSRAIWYDNAKVAVAAITGGKGRVEQPGFTALKAHYLFEARFCNPGIEGAHEKGLVESLVGYARRNFLVPLPRVAALEELNADLRQRCVTERERCVGRRSESVGQIWDREKKDMLPLPRYPMDCCRAGFARVNTLSLVQFEKARYSVPVSHVGDMVTLKAYWDRIVITHKEKVLAEHQRLYGGGESLYVEHYLPLLERRPSAVANARVFKYLPQVYLEFRDRCLDGPTPRPKEFLAVLKLHGSFAQPVVERALGQALKADVILADAVRQLCLRQLPGQTPPPPLAGEKTPTLAGWSPDPGRYGALMRQVAAE